MNSPKSLAAAFNGYNFLNYQYFDHINRAPGAHDPVLLKFGCWDARLGGKMHTLPPGQIFFHRSAGATLPQNVLWDPNLRGYLAVSAIKNIRHMIITPHSDCLAATTALKCPRPEMLPADHPEYYSLKIIHESLLAVGADLEALAQECWQEAGNDEHLAVNHMAKKLAMISYDNLLTYKVCNNGTKTVGEAVADGEVNVAVIFVDIQNGHYEYMCPETHDFHLLEENTVPAHVKTRKIQAVCCEQDNSRLFPAEVYQAPGLTG